MLHLERKKITAQDETSIFLHKLQRRERALVVNLAYGTEPLTYISKSSRIHPILKKAGGARSELMKNSTYPNVSGGSVFPLETLGRKSLWETWLVSSSPGSPWAINGGDVTVLLLLGTR